MIIIINFLLLFSLFQDILFNCFSLPKIFNYWDEFFEIIIIIIGIFLTLKKSKYVFNRDTFICLIILFLLIIEGIIGNLLFNYTTSFSFIIRDIVGFIKFPLCFLALHEYNKFDKLYVLVKNGTIKVLKFSVYVVFILGVISLFKNIGLSQNSIRYGIRPYKFLFSHPTYLVLYSILSLALLKKFVVPSKILKFELMLLFIIIITMRTKGIIVVMLYTFFRFFGKIIKKHKFLTLVAIILIVFFSSRSKMDEYESYSTSAREVFYEYSFVITKNNFPFGSGFATYASHLSRKANSKIYDFVNIPLYYTSSGEKGYSVYGDTGYPYYIGQFGLIGVILIIILSIKIYKICKKNCDGYNNLSILLVGFYIVVALTSESILIGNGFELALVLAIVSSININSTNLEEVISQ